MGKNQLATFRVDPEVWTRFKVKCLENGKSASQALSEFVEAYTGTPQGTEALDKLQETLTAISAELAVIKAVKQGEQSEGSDRTSEQTLTPKVVTGKGLTQTQICKLFGLQRNNLARDARKAGLPVEVYLSQKTKATFDPNTRKYYM
jgi:hypothetical protein